MGGRKEVIGEGGGTRETEREKGGVGLVLVFGGAREGAGKREERGKE